MATTARGQAYGVYGPPLGAGNSFTMGTAQAGSLLDWGITAGVTNPAAYLTGRNEILLEGDLWGAVSMQSRVGSPQPRPDIGSLFYLAHWGKSVFVLSYRPLRHYQAGGVYPVGELISRGKFSETEAAYSTRISPSYTLGLAASWQNGTLAERDSDNPYLLEKVSRAVLYKLKIGLQARRHNLSWGVVLHPPAVGTLQIGNPANIANYRDYSRYSFRGAWGAQLEAGLEIGKQGFAANLGLLNANTISTGNATSQASGWIVSPGVAFRTILKDNLQLFTGLRFTYAEKESGRRLLYGLGARYEVTPDVSAFAAGALVQPLDQNYAALDDVLPYDLRAGILYHGD